MADFPHLSRRGFLNRSAAVGGLLVVPGLLTACSKTDAGAATGAGALDKLREQGFVRVAYANEAPYGYMEGKELKGEAPTLHREIFKALGVDELKPTLSEWDGLIPGLQAGKYDVVSAGMAITPERCGNAIFSEPEFISPTALMVRKGNPKKVTDLDSAKEAGITIGVMSGAVEGGYAKGAGIPEGSIKTLQKPQDGADAVKGGRIDAFLLTGISLRWLAKTNPDTEVTEPFVPQIDGMAQFSPGGAVFRKGNEDLRDSFNRELKKIVSDSSRYVQLLEPYGFGKSEIPPEDLKTADLCKG
ncbi:MULTISPECIES: ectoine/hydroxyectoine ABC transporter substrate-binding protein EhuB [Streptomyces]|uniref:Ectoine/hydroxyectoine ABC transporter substrate-binding protein EhuB n=1 Tax=Streptomyces rhizosphaericola TaxID=2564098 RepID=A0ABY2PAP2_9ACTN|nr:MULTISPECIES: ectoine/hydroxyectoine ABC transporter substrate-binding protein EhuB [Streptomyces]ARI54370.1 ectoine/hydroxyectoine ABC transporter substrate-binding protein EhuB [Streptomyces sp. S8]MYT96517.1 ectoine/hydroxyectoine ABC transporter substrate-binding protein EhuB [Streptomyces sp. SID8350]NGO86477.1 ectoine/hydroxyectoine ABC transporter substrate-binding protein EhuB [Streptomyces sp. 196(2019)]TGZ04029.1 ectoine/hydroxyectoine ABC transporter substrate-binding protein EhuB